MIGTLCRSDKGELNPSDMPGDADLGGDGMEHLLLTTVFALLGAFF